MRIVVLYSSTRWPLRASTLNHLASFARYTTAQCTYVNAAVDRLAPAWQIDPDLVVYHNSFFDARWSPRWFDLMARRCHPLRSIDAPKAAMVQDEYYDIDRVCRVIHDHDIGHVFSLAAADQWPKLYGELDDGRRQFRQVLAGYLDEETTTRISAGQATVPARDIDISYRAWQAPYWLGGHGYRKVEVGEVVGRAAASEGLKVDISTDRRDTLYGDRWYELLLRSRWVIGVEGGSSILDRDGSLRRGVETYLRHNRAASFEEVASRCFPGRDGELDYAAISPRHLEAAATRTGQWLMRGHYNGILEAGRHYLALDPDYSNMNQCLEACRDDSLRKDLVEQSHEDVVASGRWTYRRLVEDVLEPTVGSESSHRVLVPLGRAVPGSFSVSRGERAKMVLLRAGIDWARKVGGTARLSAPGTWARRADATVGRARPDDGPLTRLLVVYYINERRIRRTTIDHLYCFARDERIRPIYVNVAVRRIPRYVRRLQLDGVVFDYTFMGIMHFDREAVRRPRQRVQPLGPLDLPRVAVTQDEYVNSDLIEDFVLENRVSHLLTVAPTSQLPLLYPRLTERGIPMTTVLTGYVSPELRRRVAHMAPQVERSIDIGYRARRVPAWLGRRASFKGELGAIVESAAVKRALKTDISTLPKQTLTGDEWIRFLLRCRWVLGTESGAGLTDPTGQIRSRTEAYLRAHPAAGWEELDQACFHGADGGLALWVVSPRHLEACVTRTGQILVEGSYSGILTPGVHYLELKEDLSNLDEVVEQAQDEDLRRELVENAYRDVVLDEKLSYDHFVSVVLDALGRADPPSGPSPRVPMTGWVETWASLADPLSRFVVSARRAYRTPLRWVLRDWPSRMRLWRAEREVGVAASAGDGPS